MVTSDVRFGGFTLRVDCPHCGLPVPLNAPLDRAHCAACSGDFAVPPEIFRRLLLRFDDEYPNVPEPIAQATIGGLLVHATSAASPPSCEKCGTPFELAGLPGDRPSTFHCTSCGDSAIGFPAPDWLRALVATANYVTVSDASAASGGGPDAATRDASHPIALPCPQCGAPLHITSDSARSVPCEYCKTDVYLPDDLWRRLHPVKTMAPWFVRFEGLSRAELARREAERAAAEAHARDVQQSDQAARARAIAEAEAEEAAALKAKRDAPFRAVRRFFGSASVLLLVYVFFLCPFGPCGMKGCSGAPELAMDRLSGCPEARALLGEHIGPPAFGCEPGMKNHGDTAHSGTYGALLTGSKGSGTYTWEWSSGATKLDSAVLVVGSQRLDLLSCESEKTRTQEASFAHANLQQSADQFATQVSGTVIETGREVTVPLESVRYRQVSVRWNTQAPDHVAEVRIEAKRDPHFTPEQLQSFAQKLPGSLGEWGQWSGPHARAQFDPHGTMSFQVDANQADNPGWRVQADALWKTVLNAAFGLQLEIPDAELRSLTPDGVAAARLEAAAHPPPLPPDKQEEAQDPKAISAVGRLGAALRTCVDRAAKGHDAIEDGDLKLVFTVDPTGQGTLTHSAASMHIEGLFMGDLEKVTQTYLTCAQHTLAHLRLYPGAASPTVLNVRVSRSDGKVTQLRLTVADARAADAGYL